MRSDSVNTNPGSSSINSMRELIFVLRQHRGNADGELRPLHRGALHLNAASMRFHNSLHQVQTQTSPVHLILHCPAAAKERVEDASLLVLGNAGAAIRDLDFHHHL